ncbi:MAG: LPS assembly protein LptD [Pseudomonadota bacterium]
MSLKSLTFTGVLLCAPVLCAADDQPLACGTSLDERIDLDPSLLEQSGERQIGDANGEIEFLTGSLEARLGEEAGAELRGGVVLRQGPRLAGADSANIDPLTRSLYLSGKVRYEGPSTQILSDTAEFSYDDGRVRFTGAEFALADGGSRGSADVLEVNQDGRLELDSVTYTTCPPGSEDWLLLARSIELDTESGIGTARGIRMRFKGIPILYAPAISFPLSDARKSGILTPEIGSSGNRGNEILVPYYWNIAPNYDATITPRLLTSRGLQMQTEARYLTPRNEGSAYAEYLPDDDITRSNRYLGRFKHRTELSRRWLNRLDFVQVSDSQYFEDLGGSLSTTSLTHLNRALRVDYFGEHLGFSAQIQDFQTIDDAITPEDEPYRRLPQLVLEGRWPMARRGPELAFDSELVNFDRSTGVTGWRVNLAPEISWPIRQPGWFVNPSVRYDYTRYELADQDPATDSSPDRSLPIASLDMGFTLERDIRRGSWVQTLEPRLLYVHVPFRDQSDLPVFDTITPDLNLVQLFRDNRFLGVDRIGDTDQISFGVTSRILALDSGREIMNATIGQTRYLSTRNVTLSDTLADTDESSDYIAEIRFLLLKNLNFDLAHQWGTGSSGTARSQARLQYKPSSNKVLNFAYRFRRDSLEQGDVSWSWPLSRRWNFVGRYNFSFRDDEVLEQFFGLEYESCCWGLRVVSRRFISRRDGTRDSSFGLQLVLKGMASVGTAADRLLERGILGYSADLR